MTFIPREEGFRLLRYAGAGSLSYTLAVSMFFVLTSVFEVPYLYATSMVAWVGYGVGFPIQKYWVFGSRDLYKTSFQLPLDLALKLGWNALVLAPFLLWYLVEEYQFSPLKGQMLIPFAIGVQNYALRRWLIFAR